MGIEAKTFRNLPVQLAEKGTPHELRIRIVEWLRRANDIDYEIHSAHPFCP